MYDDPGDIDRNGIPDSIQRDPVVAPPEPVGFGGPPAAPGLPGIDAPIEPAAEPVLEPVAPTPPSVDASEDELRRYQEEMAQYTNRMQTISNVLQMMDDTTKGIIRNIRD